jgi:hypothetical protein
LLIKQLVITDLMAAPSDEKSCKSFKNLSAF